MRSSVRHSLTAVAVTVALVVAANPGFADSKDDLQRKKDGLTGQLGQAQQSYDQSSKAFADAQAKLQASQADLAAAQGKLSEVRGQLAVAQARDEAMQAELARSETKLKKAQDELADGEAKLKASSVAVEQFAVQNVTEGDPGLRAFGDLLRGESPTDFADKATLRDSIGDAQVATMQKLDAQRVLLNLNREKVQALRDAVKVKRDEAAANLATMQSLEADAAAQADSVGQLVQANQANAAEADRIRAEDAAQVAALEAERVRTEQQLAAIVAEELRKAREAAAQQGGGSGGGGGSSGGGGGGSSDSGALSRPVSGSITSPYGMRVHPVTGVYKLHDGTDFRAACGTPIKAAADGTVIQQYYNGGYGNRVIVNHGVIDGKSIITTYNHLSRYAVSVGTRVSRGQVIGYVGTTGLSTGCHLHFMVLVNGNTTNPAAWL